jgi:hypothetical protein
MSPDNSIEARLEAVERKIRDFEASIEAQLQYVTNELVNHFNSEAIRSLRQIQKSAESEGADAIDRIRAYVDGRIDKLISEAVAAAQDKTSAAIVQQVVDQVRSAPAIKVQPPAYVAPKNIDGGTF